MTIRSLIGIISGVIFPLDKLIRQEGENMAVTLTVQEAMLARKIAAKEAVAGSERALAIRDTFIRGISGLSDGEVTINIGDDDAAWLSDVVSVAENEGSDAVWLAERISSQTAATVDMRP